MKQRNGWMRRSALILSLPPVFALIGCAGSAEHQPDIEPDPLTLGEMPAPEPEDAFARNLSLLEQALNQRGDLDIERTEPAPPEQASLWPDEPEVEPVATARANVAQAVSVETDDEVSDEWGDGLATGTGSAPEPTTQERVAGAAMELAGLLRELASDEPGPVSAMLRLALLDAIEPGAFEAQFASVESAAASHQLTEDERLLLQSALRTAGDLREELAQDFIDPERISAVIAGLDEQLRPVRSLALRDALLCLRVENFGVYKAVQQYEGRYKFIAGRAHPVIVYTELENFTRSPGTVDGIGGFVVNVEQALKVYRIGTEEALDSESTLVWQLPAQPVVDFSRNRLRDFFIVQVIELPQTLSVGSYRLKVLARDIPTGAEVERGIEFDIVADSSALRGSGFAGAPASDGYNPNR